MKKITALAIAGVFTASLAATAFAESDVKVGGEIRVRHEVRNNYADFSKDTNDQASVTSQRTRVNVDAKVNETTKTYISLQDTRNYGAETSTATTGNDNQAVDVSQAYVQLDQLFGQPLSLRLGRQALAYGEHRLIGNFEWSDNARRFDALKLMYNTDAVSVDLFFSTVRDTANIGTAATQAADGNGRNATFNGLYATLKMIPVNTLDLYILQKEGNVAKEGFLTYGFRLNGGTMNIDWTAEYALQAGDASVTQKQKASMYALKAGYTLPEVASLRIGAEYDFASGDDSATADDQEAFDNLYPTNHPLYGVSDWPEYITGGNALSDVKAWSINVGAKPVEGLKVVAEYWNYQTDQSYTTVGGGSSNNIGNEANLQVWYAINKNVDLHAYYAQFTPNSDLADVMAAAAGAKTDAATDAVIQVAVKF